MLRALLAASLLALVPHSADGPARIDVERAGDALLIRGIFEAAAPPAAELTYRLDVSKRGPSGTSTSRQGGAFTPAAGRADTLSTVRLGVQPGDTIRADLRVEGPQGYWPKMSSARSSAEPRHHHFFHRTALLGERRF
jgi:hypothetical protein